MAEYELNIEVRQDAGKGVARKLRAAGRVPGVCYGAGAETLRIQLDPAALERALHSSAAGINTLFDLTGASELRGKRVLVKELQRDPLNRRILHADLYAVDLTREIEVAVPLHLTGTAIGLMSGGIVDHQLREIAVSCLPGAIPEALQLDVTALEIGDSLHVRDVLLPEGVKLVSDLNLSVVSVVAPAKAEEEVVTPEAAAAAAATEGEAAPAAAEGATPERKGAAPEKS